MTSTPHTRALRARRRAAGECLDCGAPASENRVRCPLCAEADARRRALRIAARRVAGTCLDCGTVLGDGPGERPADTYHWQPTGRCLLCSEAHRQAQRTRRAARVAAGKCTRCPLPAVPGKTLCEHCAAILAHGGVEYRRSQSLRELGRCPNCGGPPEEGSAYCGPCLHKRAGYAAEARARQEALGLCVQCRAPRAPGRARCPACLENNRARALARRAAKRVASKQ